MPEWAQITWRIAEWLAVLAFATSAVFTFFSQRLNYALRWYIVTDRSLRIRTGVLSIQELTMTFSNIQEIRVSAGPLQNLLKLADVEVQSAGGGSKGWAVATSDDLRVCPMQTRFGISWWNGSANTAIRD